MSEKYWQEIARSVIAERRAMLILLGWTPPESDEHDEFWFRADHGPVHITDLWPFALQDVEQLQLSANVTNRERGEDAPLTEV